MTSEKRSRVRGITLVESLIAMAVLAFGILGICHLRLRMGRNAETARQRTEAIRLAQEKIEQMRSFEQIESDQSKQGWNDLEGGRDNLVAVGVSPLTRQWTVAGKSVDSQRVASVTVGWVNRAITAAPSEVTLTTLIARNDPIDAGGLSLAPADGPIRRVHQRDGGIPFDARRGNGRNRGTSVMAWTGSDGGYLVFDNSSGAIMARCAVEPTEKTDIATECAAMSGKWLDGYIGSEESDSGINLRIEGGECFIDHATDNHGAAIADMYRYRCIGRHRDPAAINTSYKRLDFSGLKAKASLCRYEAMASAPDLGPYTGPSHSVHHQNFLLTSQGTCPDGTVSYSSA